MSERYFGLDVAKRAGITFVVEICALKCKI